MSRQHQLKQACQYIMNAIIQNGSFDQKNIIEQDEQSSIIRPQSIMIDLDKQSESFGLFVSDTGNKKYWINMILDHLNEAHPSIHKDDRQSTSAQQLIEYFLKEEVNLKEQTLPPEPIITMRNFQLRQVELYSETPKYALLLITFQPINRDLYIFTVRNFWGQILYLSINSSSQQKYCLLLTFCLLFQYPFLILFDIIDINSSPDSHTQKQQFTNLSQRVPLAYYKVKANDSSFAFFKSKAPRYEQEINSLFSHEYNKPGALSISELEKNKIQQSLTQYHESLVQEEAKMFQAINWDSKALIKGIVKINFEKKIQNPNNQKELIKFHDFIKSECQIFIESQMKPNLHCPKDKHEKQPLNTLASCLNCRLHENKNSQASLRCPACSIIRKDDALFCDKCFQTYHTKKAILFDTSYHKLSQSDMHGSLVPNLYGTNSNERTKTCLQSEKQNPKFEKNTKKRQIQFIQEKEPQLSKNQKEKISELQKSASKLIELVSGLRNADLFYKPKHPVASSEKQFQSQLKNQVEFTKVIDKTIIRQVETFQNQIFLKICALKSSENHSKPQQKLKNIQPKENVSNENLNELKMVIEEPDGMESESSQNLSFSSNFGLSVKKA